MEEDATVLVAVGRVSPGPPLGRRPPFSELLSLLFPLLLLLLLFPSKSLTTKLIRFEGKRYFFLLLFISKKRLAPS